MGDMKGVEDSEADPNVAALDMSDPLPLGCCCLPPPFPENFKIFLTHKCFEEFHLDSL